MSGKSITAGLMGGLGNQMFQYAMARALALRNSVPLYLDTRTGFARDTIYRRTFELQSFDIQASEAPLVKRLPFLWEKFREKTIGSGDASVQRRPWGRFVREAKPEFLDDVARLSVTSDTWLQGYWQSERYFAAISEVLANELAPPPPSQDHFLETARTMRDCNSVAVGVRLFEEVPGGNKAGVGGLTSMNFYNDAAMAVAAKVRHPVFFVFCTHMSPSFEQLKLPGEIHYITHDNGFNGTLERLWLFSQCSHFVLSNSSFYWWGAWLAERREPSANIFASALFPNRDTIPARWTAVAA